MPFIILYLAIAVLVGWAWFTIFRRLGWNTWWAVGAIIPVNQAHGFGDGVGVCEENRQGVHRS